MATALDIWAHSKSIALCFLAREAATAPDALVTIVNLSKAGRWPQAGIPRLTFSESERFYRNSLPVWRIILTALLGYIPARHFCDAAQLFRRLSIREIGLTEAEINEIRDFQGTSDGRCIVRYLKFFDRWHRREIQRRIHDKAHQNPFLLDMPRLMQKKSVRFFFQVLMPCLIEYGIHPTILLRKARTGDHRALVKLLAIDPSVIRDKGIEGVLDLLRDKPKSRIHKTIAALITIRTKKKLTRKQVKVKTAAYLQMIGERLHQPMTTPALRELHDAVARDGGDACDFDLPTSPESFAKAIKREQSQRRA